MRTQVAAVAQDTILEVEVELVPLVLYYQTNIY